MYSGEKLDYLCGRVVFGGRKRLTVGRKVGLGGREVLFWGSQWYSVGEDGHFLCEDVVFGGESWYYFVGGDVVFWGENGCSEKGMLRL